jgi:glycosyltransferase involved in cell wall biosynthesis
MRLGLIFQDIKNWQGGFNYYCSLITSLKYLNSSEDFSYVIFTNKKNSTFLEKKLKIKKENIYLSSIFSNISLFKLFSKFFECIFRRDIVLDYFFKKNKVNIITHFCKKNSYLKFVPWIPDLQHKHLKENFSKYEIKKRNSIINLYLESSKDIIVSSNDTKKSLNFFFDVKKNDIHILNFVPQVDFNNICGFKELQSKYNIPEKYIYIPNQFWVHKNHEVVIRSAFELKKKNFFFKFILSGNPKDYRNINHFHNIKKLINALGVVDYFEYLGQVSRKELLNLIYHAQIIINPSKFEGWSTIVEEAKILNKRLLLSNIPVHNEQINENCVVFSTNDEQDLATKIVKILNQNFPSLDLDCLSKNYVTNRKKFAHQYLNIIKEVNLK